MQAQFVQPLQSHPDYHYDGLGQILPDTYLTPPNFTNGFSRGSHSHQDYRYLFDRGELSARLYSTNLVGHTYDATGLGFAGNPPSESAFVVGPEDIPAYEAAHWDWTAASSPGNGIVAAAPVYPLLQEDAYLGSKPSGNNVPPTQLPTPAAMAVLLNPHGRSDREHSQSGYPEAPTETSPVIPSHTNPCPAAAVSPIIRREESSAFIQNQGTSDGLSREKKHACTMCHKRFDRPSTLKKHLLVHTGEKAFVCDTCGRRFGVASNLNRHVKRCILKPVNVTSSPSHKSTSGSPSSPVDSPSTSTMSSPNQTNVSSAALGKRSRTSSITSPPDAPNDTSNQLIALTTSSGMAKSKVSGQKRRRRAPSPSQWVPETLQNFNLLSEDSYRVTQVPLPPVRRNPPHEERDSWDENANQTPYHPCGWRGTLPGPGLGHGFGLGGKDMRNLDLGGRGGFMLGRVLVF